MRLEEQNIQSFERFLNMLRQDVYPEPGTTDTVNNMRQVMEYIEKKFPGALHGKILDVGCGHGNAMELFLAAGMTPVGITLDQKDKEACWQKGLTVYEMDQSFLDFPDGEFDFLWCKHCLEHSIFPYFTLHGFFRAIKAGGYCYIEVPAPDTPARHQTNKNHYSVFGKSMWTDLILRTGFTGETVDIDVITQGGQKDIYWGFILQKPRNA